MNRSVAVIVLVCFSLQGKFKINLFFKLKGSITTNGCDCISVVWSAAASRRPKSDQANGQNCTNHLQVIDKCSSLATYSYTTSFNQYPLNSNEMKASCDRIGDGLKCLKTHGKCLSSVARRSLNSYSGARSRHSKKLCSNLNDAKTIEFWKANECIKNKNKREVMIASEKKLISTIQMLAVNTTMKWEDRFYQACCSASHYKTKVIKDTEPECAKYKVATEDMLNSMVGELLESACPEQTRLNEICSKLPKLTLVEEWKAVSLTGAALDLIVALADNPKE